MSTVGQAQPLCIYTCASSVFSGTVTRRRAQIHTLIGTMVEFCHLVVHGIDVEIIQERSSREAQVMTVPVRIAVWQLQRAVLSLFEACRMGRHTYDDCSEDDDLERNGSLHSLFDATTASFNGSEDGTHHEVELTVDDKWVRGFGMFAMRLQVKDAARAFIDDANRALANRFAVHAEVFAAFRRANVIRELLAEDLQLDMDAI
jgi:hypothetical protein